MKQMKNKVKNRIISGLPYAAVFASSFTCCFFIPEFNVLSGPVTAVSENVRSPFIPGELPACFPLLLKQFNLAAASFVAASLITLTSFLISATIKLLSGKGERSIPFIASVILIWISADRDLPATYLAALPLQIFLFSLLAQRKMIWFLPALLFPILYMLTGGFSIILAGMLIFRLITQRPNDRISFLLFTVSVVMTVLLSAYLSPVHVLYPLDLPDESFRRMLFFLLTGIIVMLPAYSVIDLHMTTYISIKYNNASILISLIIILSVTLIALHESGFLFLK